ncbi:bone morphogenetic protein 1-like [Saccostrea cucullata]|uniref:bone morphogenetic protein 1-like n=1 Tax=Saccostrea cuccullata TaxID=36930 RepID=UPI002ECFFB2E
MRLQYDKQKLYTSEAHCSNPGNVHIIEVTEQKTLTSPNFPAHYPMEIICTYTYSYTGGNVNIEFIYLNVEEEVNGECFDFIEIFNGRSTNSPLMTKVCGFTTPTESFTSSNSSLTIRFTSDSMGTKIGFLAYITPIAYSPTKIESQTSETVLQTLDKLKGPLIGSGVVFLCIIIATLCFFYFKTKNPVRPEQSKQ